MKTYGYCGVSSDDQPLDVASGSLAVVAINKVGRESFNHFGSPAFRNPAAYLLGSSGRR